MFSQYLYQAEFKRDSFSALKYLIYMKIGTFANFIMYCNMPASQDMKVVQ